jgi:hypothetical protein
MWLRFFQAPGAVSSAVSADAARHSFLREPAPTLGFPLKADNLSLLVGD